MSDLITTIVATVVLVIVIGGLILVTALYWTQIAARLRGKKHEDNRFATDSEKQQWPQPKSSTDISPVSTPPISPRSSQFGEASQIAAPPRTQQPHGQAMQRWQ